MKYYRTILLACIALIFTAAPSPASAQEILAVLDRSEKPIENMSEAQLGMVLDALRGEARKVLGEQILVLSSTNTIQILLDNGVDPTCIDESCQLSMARSLQATWLLSTNILPLGSKGYIMQIGFYETANGNLLEMRECEATDWIDLKTAAQAEGTQLYQNALPDETDLANEPTQPQPPRRGRPSALKGTDRMKRYLQDMTW